MGGMMDGMMGTCMNTKSMDVVVLLLRHHQQLDRYASASVAGR